MSGARPARGQNTSGRRLQPLRELRSVYRRLLQGFHCSAGSSRSVRTFMECRLVVAGVGGQGVIYAAKILSQAALARGERVIVSENHGMSQRGGSVLAHVKIGGSELPLIRRATADALIAFDRTEAVRNLTFARSGGSVFVNGQQPFEAV